jgi:tetraacyldisaccharide 4'-kinase
MKPPAFWNRSGLPARLLAPLGAMTAAITARRVARPGWRAPVPVLCIGNVTTGGTGKTPIVLDFAARLRAGGAAVHILTRGYGGHLRGPVRVGPARHTAAEVGDEALLLAAAAPCWVGADRAAAARAAIAAGAGVLLLDDGLQNPGLAKDCSVLVIDGETGFANRLLLPAGPLREPVHAAASRCRAAVMMGADRTGAASLLPAGLPVVEARLEPGPAMRAMAGQPVFAFAGIGRPDKFFATLRRADARRHPSVRRSPSIYCAGNGGAAARCGRVRRHAGHHGEGFRPPRTRRAGRRDTARRSSCLGR